MSGSGKKWTTAEFRFIVENYPTMTIDDIARRLGRSRMSVWHFIDRNDITKGYPNEWTKDEIIIIRTLYNILPRESIERLIPRHTYNAIRHKAYVMGFVNLKRRKR